MHPYNNQGNAARGLVTLPLGRVASSSKRIMLRGFKYSDTATLKIAYCDLALPAKASVRFSDDPVLGRWWLVVALRGLTGHSFRH